MRLGDEASSGWLLKAIGCAGVTVLACYFIAAWFARAVGPLKEMGRSLQCQGNLKRLVAAQRMYADDYDDRLPPAPQWMDRVAFFVDPKYKLTFSCPEVRTPAGDAFGYAMNAKLSAKVRAKVTDLDVLPLIFDSPDLTRSAVAKEILLPTPGRHIGNAKKGDRLSRGNYVGLGDGGVRFRPESQAAKP